MIQLEKPATAVDQTEKPATTFKLEFLSLTSLIYSKLSI